MHVAIPLYPRFTALDAVGPYQVFAFTPGWQVTFVAPERGSVVDDRSMELNATATLEEVQQPDIVVIPGGPGTVQAMQDDQFLSWLRSVDEHTTWTASVCTGSLILAAAGLLAERKATTHWAWRDRLADLGVVPVTERVVFDGKVVTAAGVSAGIDMALALVARQTDNSIAQAVQLGIEYDPAPPFNAGSPTTAPADIVDLVRAVSRDEVQL